MIICRVISTDADFSELENRLFLYNTYQAMITP